jgi:hypothetical protein
MRQRATDERMGGFKHSAEAVTRLSKPKESTADIPDVAQPYLKETHFNAGKKSSANLCVSPRPLR